MNHFLLTELRQRLADVRNNFTFLHAGCGSGEIIKELILLPHADRLVGIDFRQHLLHKATEACRDARISFQEQTFRDFESTFNFDLILVSAPLNHFADPGSGLIKCYFLLREKGTLILETQPGGNFDQKLWRAELEDCGFEFVRFTADAVQSESLIVASKSAISRTAWH